MGQVNGGDEGLKIGDGVGKCERVEAGQVKKKEEEEDYLLTLYSMRRRVNLRLEGSRQGAQTQTSKERLLSFCRVCVCGPVGKFLECIGRRKLRD